MLKHFKFGENWKDFSNLIDEERLNESIKSLIKLSNRKTFKKLSFLDIGCGSGLSSLAAIKLNCKKLYAIDQDKESIRTTKKTLRGINSKKIKIEKKDLFMLNENEKYDIVYSWGVLHHTGKMVKAIEKSTKMVTKDGILIIALYKKTRLCNFWKIEKKIYSKSPKIIQNFIKFLFILLFRLAMFLKKKILPNIKVIIKKKRNEF